MHSYLSSDLSQCKLNGRIKFFCQGETDKTDNLAVIETPGNTSHRHNEILLLILKIKSLGSIIFWFLNLVCSLVLLGLTW